MDLLQPEDLKSKAFPKPTSSYLWQVLLNSEYYVFPIPSSLHWWSSGKKTAGRPRTWRYGATHHHLPEHAGRDPHTHIDHTQLQGQVSSNWVFPNMVSFHCLNQELQVKVLYKLLNNTITTVSPNLLLAQGSRAPSFAYFSSFIPA